MGDTRLAFGDVACAFVLALGAWRWCLAPWHLVMAHASKRLATASAWLCAGLHLKGRPFRAGQSLYVFILAQNLGLDKSNFGLPARLAVVAVGLLAGWR